MLYYNPDDAALFVQRRWGTGYTMNLGNPKSWLPVSGLLAAILVLDTITVILMIQ